jgi:hypothetical protein
MAQQHRAIGKQLTAAIAADPTLLQRLLKDPKGTADAIHGSPVPPESAIRIAYTGAELDNARDTDIVIRVPENTDLSVEELESVAGGDNTNISCGTGGSTNAYACTPGPKKLL